ncbi:MULTISPECIES: hypothetical protein [Microvirga]|uniref:hypothetical protein n=1 Tax=Microvirga TaxID=186650 RepID=UPI001CFFB9DD|nr:hypothetical protein [Microvirga lenta]MCB5175742.1 hypothetical protein [Microvirga lenta]
MAVHLEHFRYRARLSDDPFYPEDIQPRLQSILASLADIDFAHEKSIESIRHSLADEAQKRELIAVLRRRHQERRAPYVRELAELKSRIEAIFA